MKTHRAGNRDQSVSYSRRFASIRGLSHPICILGFTQLLLWTVIAQLSMRFMPGTELSERPLLLILGLLGGNFLLYLASIALLWNKQGVRLVFIFGLLFRLPLWFSYPVQESDFYRYLWDGRVLAAGVNPYQYSPALVESARDGSSGDADLERLKGMLRTSPESAEIFSRIDHRTVPTIYPPFSQAVFASVAFLTPEIAPVLAQIRILKGVLAIFDVATVVLVIGILRNLRLPTGRAVAYGWCPLVLKEFANSGHMDSIAIFLTTSVFWQLTRTCDNRLSRSNSSAVSVWAYEGLVAVIWGCAILTKLYPIVLAPLLIVSWWRRFQARTALLILVCSLVVVLGYALMPSKSTLADDANLQEKLRADRSTQTAGLRQFLQRWEMNDLLFSIVYENIRSKPQFDESADPWYVIMPHRIRQTIDTTLSAGLQRMGITDAAKHADFLLAQGLAFLVLASIWMRLALTPWPDDNRRELLERSFLSLAWLWFFSATQNPWYWTWAMPLIVFANPTWLLVSGCALIYYLRFWLVYWFPSATLPLGLTGERFFDEVVVWFEHGIPLMLLVFCASKSVFSRSEKN